MNSTQNTFSESQKEYLEGFFRSSLTSSSPSPDTSIEDSSKALPYSEVEALGYQSQKKILQDGKRLSKEEKIKHNENALDIWPKLRSWSQTNTLPEGEDIFHAKFHGLFNVSPAQESFMCRLRIPGGILNSTQFKTLANLSDTCGNGTLWLTTRSNVQIREIAPKHTLTLLNGLQGCGLTSRGSGADNVRNVTGNPTAGIDRQEFYNVLPLCQDMHYHIMNQRALYGLPRKFNISFDGGSSISTLEDSNDIGFKAVKRTNSNEVFFRVALGGISGHLDLARDTGLLIKPEECVSLADAMLRVFIEHGNRQNRKKARLKYLLDDWGFEKFIAESEKVLGYSLERLPLSDCIEAPVINKFAHIGTHPQSQKGLHYVGVHVPVGKISSEQARKISDIANTYGSGTIRLTVWQNFLISDIPTQKLSSAIKELENLGFSCQPNWLNTGLAACTGAEGCKFGLAATKKTALAIEEYISNNPPEELNFDSFKTPINIHITGCSHSCAQHYIGDIGLLGSSIELDGVKQDTFHMYLGGGYGTEGAMAKQLFKNILATEIPQTICDILSKFKELQINKESFYQFTNRHSLEELQEIFTVQEVSA